MNGNDYLSSLDRRLWDFCYHVLLKFGCPIIFKKEGPNCSLGIDLHISFFVPDHHEQINKIIEFIEHEWEEEKTEGKIIDDCYAFGTKISVYTFNGSELYAEKEVVKEMSQKAMKYFLDKVEDMKFLKANKIKPF